MLSFGAMAVVLVGVVAAAVRVSRRVAEEKAPADVHPAGDGAPPGGPVEPENHVFQVETADGKVEAFREGQWIPVRRGELLTLEDVVRTGPGRAVLRLGTAEIELREHVEVRLESISRAGASVDLRRGKLLAHTTGAGQTLVVSALHTRTTSDGPSRFVVLADDGGRVSVAATEGAARFSAHGTEVAVPAGTTAYADPGQAPSALEKIDENVLLSVVWPAGERHEASATIAGRAPRGAAVRVNGASAEVSAAGTFRTTVRLREGVNDVHVETEDLVGRTKAADGQVIRRPSKPPELQPETDNPWRTGAP